MKNPTVYLSGPMHNIPDNGKGWRQDLITKYTDFTFLDPTRHEIQDVSVVELDETDIKKSDGLIANVWVPSVGTSMEIYLAFTTGKLVVVVTPDLQSLWLTAHCHFMTTSLDDGMRFLQEAFEKGFVPTAIRQLPKLARAMK
jgi:hypothetical protein